jgi:hypothetical protein
MLWIVVQEGVITWKNLSNIGAGRQNTVTVPIVSEGAYENSSPIFQANVLSPSVEKKLHPVPGQEGR